MACPSIKILVLVYHSGGKILRFRRTVSLSVPRTANISKQQGEYAGILPREYRGIVFFYGLTKGTSRYSAADFARFFPIAEILSLIQVASASLSW